MNKNLNLEKYEQMLLNAKNVGYQFLTFGKDIFLNNNKKYNNRILLRHDIDVSPKAAYEMAIVEHKKEIKATYFFMLRSPLYNIFSRSSSTYVKKIMDLGHDIGLHYDAGFYDEDDYDKFVYNEILFNKYLLEKEFNTTINAISFHQPSETILKSLFKFPEGLINTYSTEINNNYFYYSDTNQNIKWIDDSDNNLIDSLSNKYPQNMQILIHPIWWFYKGENAQNTWTNALQNIFNDSQEQLVKCERAFGKSRTIKVKI